MTATIPADKLLRSTMFAELAPVVAACGTAPMAPTRRAGSPRIRTPSAPALTAMCETADPAQAAESTPPDTVMRRQLLVRSVRDRGTDSIGIPFHVGESRSHTWVITGTPAGLRLTRDHRHEGGALDSVTIYGGDNLPDGTCGAQEFRADSLTASLIPPAQTNVGTLELHPGHRFVFALRDEGSKRTFRAFDLTSPVPVSPPVCGANPQCESITTKAQQ